MKFRKWLVIGTAMASCQIASANLLVNGDFSQPGIAGQLGSVTVSNWNVYGATSGWYANDIDSQMSVKIWNTDTGIYQDWSVTEGQAYNFQVSCYQWDSDHLVTAEGYLKVEWYDASNAQLGLTVLDTMTASDSYNTWVPLSGTATAAVGAAYGRVVLGLQGTMSGDELFFDNADVSVAAVPEPATLAMFGLGILGLLRLRRKVAK